MTHKNIKIFERSWDNSGGGILIFKFSSKVDHTSKQHPLRSQKLIYRKKVVKEGSVDIFYEQLCLLTLKPKSLDIML
jgi:hypothetical protein